MLVDSIGVYSTVDGNIAYVTETDGYRRCYGYMADSPDFEMSWYTSEGNVRHGLSCGPDFNNQLRLKLKIPLPENAHKLREKDLKNMYKDAKIL